MQHRQQRYVRAYNDHVKIGALPCSQLYGSTLSEDSAVTSVQWQIFFFFSSRRRHTRLQGDWSSDVCSSDLTIAHGVNQMAAALGWRERMQDQAGRLLSALNAPPREATAGGSFGPALDVIAGARSEERRGGKEGRSRWAPDDLKKKKM